MNDNSVCCIYSILCLFMSINLYALLFTYCVVTSPCIYVGDATFCMCMCVLMGQMEQRCSHGVLLCNAQWLMCL